MSTAVMTEPTTIALLAIGLVGFTGAEVRRKLKKVTVLIESTKC